MPVRSKELYRQLEEGIIVTAMARMTSVLGFASALMVFILVGLAVTTGVSQEYFEGEHPPAEYAQRIIAAAPALRVGFTFDNLFVLAYSCFFVALASVLRRSADAYLVNVALAAMIGVALLDAIENHHIMAMADAAVQGSLPTAEEIRAQTVLSLMKFHLSCIGALLFAMAFPRETTLGRWVVGMLVAYAVFGILVLTAPASLLDLLALIRTVFFVVSFLVVAVMMWRFQESTARPVEANS
jgi:hypothetical protein